MILWSPTCGAKSPLHASQPCGTSFPKANDHDLEWQSTLVRGWNLHCQSPISGMLTSMRHVLSRLRSSLPSTLTLALCRQSHALFELRSMKPPALVFTQCLALCQAPRIRDTYRLASTGF